MLFVIHCHDKPDHGHLRAENRPAHLEYIEANRENLYIAGPTLNNDGDGMNGSLLIIDFPDRAAAVAFAEADPYALAGLFESVTIQPWKEVFPPAT